MPADQSVDERLRRVFCEVLQIPDDRFDEDLSVGDIAEWDSIAHVTLLMSIEAEFGVTFDVTDAIDVESLADLRSLVTRYLSATR